MRKLLLGTTALAAAATFSANVALADISDHKNFEDESCPYVHFHKTMQLFLVKYN